MVILWKRPYLSTCASNSEYTFPFEENIEHYFPRGIVTILKVGSGGTICVYTGLKMFNLLVA